MMSKQITLSICVPAFNEGANIEFLLKEILEQKLTSARLLEIIVFSDGSEDSTALKVESIRDSRIKLIQNSKRQGVAYGLNVMFAIAQSDVLVLLNADIKIEDKMFLEKLVKPIVFKEVNLTSASLEEISPKTFFEKVLFTGMKFKKNVFIYINGGNNVYTCYGPARAFSKKLYKAIHFKPGLADDMFSYFFSKVFGFTYNHAKEAKVLYKLPDNYKDHKSQSTRFSGAIEKAKEEFGTGFVEREMQIPKKLLFVEGLKMFLRQPILFLSYIGVLVFSKVSSTLKRQKVGERWPVAHSSKLLR